MNMENSEHLRKTLEHYRQQRQQKLEELRPIELMIRQLEIDLGEAPAGTSSGGPEGASLPNPQWVHVKGVSVKPDEFFTMSQSDAAKAYLRKVGHAIPFEDLVDALRRGGAKLGGADPKKTLYVSLARNPRKEFVWPSKEHISLAEFYGDRTK